MKSTPGPWRPYETTDGAWHIVGATRVIAKCHTFEPGSPQMAADARLIASAPDLYAALDYIEAGLSTFADPPVADCLDAARAALAKARGET